MLQKPSNSTIIAEKILELIGKENVSLHKVDTLRSMCENIGQLWETQPYLAQQFEQQIIELMRN